MQANTNTVSAKFSAEEIIEIAGGRLAQGMLPDEYGAICTDTRQIKEGDWYLALSGEKFDGHDFLGDAFARGAIGCIVCQRANYAIANGSYPLIAVTNTLEAYQDLARSWRRKVNPLVVAVTGSSGKTTTKEMCASIFSAKGRVHKSRANENNEIGVPKTILSMPDDTQYLILEMAMRAQGEIAVLADIGLPDIGIVVNAGVAHLGPLAGVENIIKAKCELLEKLNPDEGVAIIGQPTESLMARVSQVFKGKTLVFPGNDLKELEVTPDLTRFRLASYACEFEVHAHGQSHMQDAWCAITAARQAGIEDQVIAQGLKLYEPPGGRGKRLTAKNGAVVIDESYNANPDSVRSSVSNFVDSRVFPLQQKFLVLGGLAELGDTAASLHHDLGRWLKDKKLIALITVGPLARHIADGAQGAAFEIIACQDQVEAEKLLRSRLTSDSGVLIKGSRSANLDRLVALLVNY